ncbi:hypothetical protein B0H17DRAFT_1223110 [Mycena rosella]|uniref:Uncharacterized protein n=1 Tax=Mycena rosella TaxID=1033263 RepID=A0AAD7AX19_MYCRO|nr:hypothetical protein B0H17DRAFT_1223110 [Mycena rosella]
MPPFPESRDAKKPYETRGYSAIASTFFKGNNPIAERITAMFGQKMMLATSRPHLRWLLSLTLVFTVSSTTTLRANTSLPTSTVAGCKIYTTSTSCFWEKLKAKHPQQYRATMENIFTVASRGSSFAKGPKAPLTLLQKEALAMLNFSD